MNSGAVRIFFVFLLILIDCFVVDGNGAATDRFLKSSCGKLLESEDKIDREHMEAMLPSIEFWEFFPHKKSAKNDILLVDVDKHSWNLLLNQVVALRKSGSGLAENVYAIAYDNSTCHNLVTEGVRCYYSKDWNNQLISKYTEQTHHAPTEIHVIMLGRMMTTAVALCEGHNVFLSDTDVVFYRDPIQYAFHEADLMITATKIHPHNRGWGGNFFADSPSDVFTLNNGVVLFRTNAVTKAFALTLAADCINSLKNRDDVQQGFLQTVFNAMMDHNKLILQPSSALSDPTTYQLNTSHLTNTVGECFDCYFGQFPWYSNVVHPPTEPGQGSMVLRIGVYPMQRFTSFCKAPPGYSSKAFNLILVLCFISVFSLYSFQI